MRKIKIIADSCADLNSELIEKYGLDYAKMSTVHNGVESPAMSTWSNEEAHSLYELIRQGERITTAQVSSAEFQGIFTKYVNEGYDIIYIACSSKQSGSVNTGSIVARRIMEENEGVRIECIDSQNASIGIGMLAIEAANMAEKGMSFDDIVERVLFLRKRVNQFVTVHSLTYLKRAGRVKGPAAFFGNLLGVKPILISDADGEQAAYKKVKGRQNSFNEVISMLKESIIEPEKQTVYVVHSDCPQDEVNLFVDMIKEVIPCKDIYVTYIGPIIGASIGPDAIGVFAFGKEVTFKVGETK